MSTEQPNVAMSPAEFLRARGGGRGRGRGRGGSVRLPVSPAKSMNAISTEAASSGEESPPAVRSPIIRGRGRGAGTGLTRTASDSPTTSPGVDHHGDVAVRPRMGGSSQSVRRPTSTSYVGEASSSSPAPGPTWAMGIRGRQPSPGSSPSSRGGARPLPKFTDMEGGDDEDTPTPPPRSPRLSPRLARMPTIPPRPSATPSARPPMPPTDEEAAGDKEARRATMRSKCVSEIYQTEKDYIEDLEILINVFIFPMRTMASVDDKVLYAIFSNVEVFIHFNKEMLLRLEKIVEDTPPGQDEVIGFVFTQLADYFKMYKVYCANQGTSLSTVETMSKKNAQFKKILDVCHSDARCRGLFLQSFLIKPIQRVCKYPLLIRELIRYTPESHPDWEPLQAAFSKINSVVSDINEAQRQAEGLQRILDLQSLIDGVDSLVAPGRNYVKEGELTQYKSAKSKSGEKRHVFFFTDLILLTLRRGEKRFEHKLSVDLDSCKLVVLADSSYIKNSFELSTGDSNAKGKKCILSGETPDESNQWIKEIRGLIKSYQKRKLEDMKRHQASS